MRNFFILILTLTLQKTSTAQTTVGDSVRYYEKLSAKYEQRALEAARKADSGQLITNRLQQLKAHSRSYTALMIFTEAAGADFSNFNTAIARDGFAPFSGPVWRFGLGISHKSYNGIIFDFTFFTAGIDKSQKSGDSKITTNFSNYFGFQLGYTIVNTHRFDLYPYAGLSARNNDLTYSTPATINTNYHSIASLIASNQSAGAFNYNLGYSAGVCAEWVVVYNKKSESGTMLFAKFGTDNSFGNENYRISGVDYSSGIKYGAWVADIGFKFFGR